MQESSPVMEDFYISAAGTLKLLKNLKPRKAASLDRLKLILLKNLRLLCRSFLSAPLKQASFHQSGVITRSVLSSNQRTNGPENAHLISWPSKTKHTKPGKW